MATNPAFSVEQPLIYRETSRDAAAAPLPLRHYAPWLLVGAIVLTFAFAAQQAIARLVAGLEPQWGAALALNALDWIVWGSFVPLIVQVGVRARLGVEGRQPGRIAVWIALGLACVSAASFVTGVVLRAWPDVFLGASRAVPDLGRWMITTFTFNTLIFAVIAGSLHAALYREDLQRRRQRQAELEARLTRSELTVLRNQLHPHFLFNALHTVSSLMISDVPAAQRVIAALGTLLRASIDHTARQEISFREELEFVGLYLDVQRARFRQRLRVEIDVAEELGSALVPSLVLQPIVENAIRHGVEPSPSGGTIRIEAHRIGEQMTLRVQDESSFSSPLPASKEASGIGLANIESRLAQLYGERCRFEAGRDELGRFTVTIALPFHTEAR